ncbi:hypothetical protein BKA69DRAFT_1067632 [Paraphysoderma sedebokerense]|nr:hypothetical protein BKA69DRAFT_1067632 [Paraphysoderma sedebokerense]
MDSILKLDFAMIQAHWLTIKCEPSEKKHFGTSVGLLLWMSDSKTIYRSCKRKVGGGL